MSGIVHAETFGEGPDLVLVHGWAMHGEIWREFAEGLALEFRVTLIDLPGHGHSTPWKGGWNLRAWVDAVADAAPEEAHWLGWSLGGLVCQQLALSYPQQVGRLVLLASSPRFVQGDTWMHAKSPDVLAGFVDELQNDYEGTLKRFLALEVEGSDHARDELRLLRERLFKRGEPSAEALTHGLKLLEETDLRMDIGAIESPTLWIFGKRDNLVPVPVSEEIKRYMPQAQTLVVPGAGHAPFLAHPTIVQREVSRFLYD